MTITHSRKNSSQPKHNRCVKWELGMASALDPDVIVRHYAAGVA
jgi:hypothetical protein